MQYLESLREVESVRFRLQMNNRLRLESLAQLSRLFREFGEPISDDVLSSLIFALPQELISNGHNYVTDPGMKLADEKSPKPNTPPFAPLTDAPPLTPNLAPIDPNFPASDPNLPRIDPNTPPLAPKVPSEYSSSELYAPPQSKSSA